MQNPNAVASLVAGGVTLAVQWLLQKYAHASLSDYWKGAITVAVTTTTLYVGRDGLVGGLKRAFDTWVTILLGPKKPTS